MPLGDIRPFDDWLQREDPPVSLMRAVKNWIDGLDHAPWQAPSVPIAEMSVEGEFQTRSAVVLGIEILFHETYATQITDLLDVRALR